MPQKRRCLVVVSVVSGRNFVDKPSASIIVEAKLDREILSTDPVPHCPSPNFEQELAWEVDRASLKQYRLQRTSIKLQIFAVHCDDSRDHLGYVVLDIRAATEHKVFKWFSVLNSKLRPSPEIYCGLYIDPCNIGITDVPTDFCSTALSVKPFVENFENQLVSGFQLSDSEFFPSATQDCYLISVVLVSIPQLSKLLPKDLSPSSKFKLFLRFLDNDLFFWEFTEEDCTKLAAHHCRFLIRSSMESIKGCFLQSNLFEIRLYVEDKQIGYCQGNLPLISGQINSNTRYPFCVDSTFTLNSPQTGNGDSPIILRFNIDKCDIQPVPNSPTQNVTKTERPPFDVDSALAQMHNTQQPAPPQQQVTPRSTAPGIPTNYTTENGQLRRFCYVIELKTIRAHCDSHLPKDIFVYAKYVYPLFGTTNPIMTLPPVQLSTTEDKHFSQGFCAFELAADFAEFKSRLLEEPLNVEILGRSPEATGGSEPSLGWAVIPLGEVFSRPIVNLTNSQRRSKDGIAEVKLNGKPVAQIIYSLVLDDFGLFNSSPAAEVGLVNKFGERSPIDVKKATENVNTTPTDIRQTSEYRTALELELWKANEEERFKDALKHREQKMLVVFAQEWKRRDEEREALCKKKMQEYQLLENKLRSVLEALMERERQLNAKETNLNAVQLDLERKIELRERDLKDGVQRKVRETEQALGAERQRSSQLSNELAHLRERYQGLEERLTMEQQLKATAASAVPTFDSRRATDQTRRDEEEIRRLQLELVRLTTELTGAQGQLSSLERRLDGALRGRLRYKDLWTRALQEVARLRQEAANATKQELQRKQAEVEGLRREQSLLLRAGDIHNPPAQVNGGNAQRMEGMTSTNPADSPNVYDPILDVHLKRLLEERECLLASGVYYKDDELIVDLDKEIQRLRLAITSAT
ncbi:hypothetical protein Aperf_G00000076821 [Anoplocephala perfoliata]